MMAQIFRRDNHAVIGLAMDSVQSVGYRPQDIFQSFPSQHSLMSVPVHEGGSYPMGTWSHSPGVSRETTSRFTSLAQTTIGEPMLGTAGRKRFQRERVGAQFGGRRVPRLGKRI